MSHNKPLSGKNKFKKSFQLATLVATAAALAAACNPRTPDDAQISSAKLPEGVVGNPNCLSFVEKVESGSFGTTRSQMPRVKVALATFKGKDIRGRACQVTLKSTGVDREGYQTITFSAQFSDIRLPASFRNIGESSVGLDTEGIENAPLVLSKMRELGYDPQTFFMQQPLMSFSSVFGPIPPAPQLGQPVRVIHLAVSKHSCEPVYVMFNSNYPWEKKADLCILEKANK